MVHRILITNILAHYHAHFPVGSCGHFYTVNYVYWNCLMGVVEHALSRIINLAPVSICVPLFHFHRLIPIAWRWYH